MPPSEILQRKWLCRVVRLHETASLQTVHNRVPGRDVVTSLAFAYARYPESSIAEMS